MIFISLYKEYGIYGIINIHTNMIYVGKTTMNFGDRRDSHFACLRNGYHGNKYLQQDFNKWGEDNFKFIILHKCENENLEEVNDLERKYIKQYKDLNLAYNLADGGDECYFKGKHLSEETKRKIGQKNKINMTGRKASDETRRKMSETQKKRYAQWTDEQRKEWGSLIGARTKGTKWNDEQRKHFSEIQATSPNSAKYTPDFIRSIRKMYEEENYSITEIAQKVNIPRGTVYGIVTYRRWAHIV